MTAERYAFPAELFAAEPPARPEWETRSWAWVISRYDDARAVLRSASCEAADLAGAIDRVSTRSRRPAPRLIAAIGANSLFQTGEPHARCREQVAELVRAVTPRWPVERVDALVAGYLARLPREGEVDLVAALAGPLPDAITAGLLGMPPESVAEAKAAGFHLLAAARLTLPVRDYGGLDAQMGVIHDRLRAAPREGLAMLSPEGEIQTFAELALITASAFTITSTIAAAAALLAHMPELQADLRARPDRIGAFVEEVLRLVPPVIRLSLQVTTAAVEIGGQPIAAGQGIIVDVNRCHRDRAAFPDALLIDLNRRGAPHLAFGGGGHACLGSRLARTEIVSAVRLLLAGYALAPGRSAPDIGGTSELRHIRTMPVHVTAIGR